MKIFNHTPEQQNALAGLLGDVAKKLVELNFNDPKDDGASIRYHAYNKGKLDLLRELLEDNFDIQQPTQGE